MAEQNEYNLKTYFSSGRTRTDHGFSTPEHALAHALSEHGQHATYTTTRDRELHVDGYVVRVSGLRVAVISKTKPIEI